MKKQEKKPIQCVACNSTSVEEMQIVKVITTTWEWDSIKKVYIEQYTQIDGIHKWSLKCAKCGRRIDINPEMFFDLPKE